MLETNVNISALRVLFHEKLSPLYEQREIDAIFFTYIDAKFNLKKHHYFLTPDRCIGFEQSDIEMLAEGCPIQYVTGKTTFCNVELSVNPSVLIPRQETEELTGRVIERRKEKGEGRKIPSPLAEKVAAGGKEASQIPSFCRHLMTEEVNVLDLCTGSGAIAIALAKNIKNATVWATDISEKALEIAKKNAERNNLKINFLCHDILQCDVELSQKSKYFTTKSHKGYSQRTQSFYEQHFAFVRLCVYFVYFVVKNSFKTTLPNNFDIIVSNPPYIPESERINLHKNIVNYEPGNALFVPDENPLVFYVAIADMAKKILREGGVLYFETHEKFASEVCGMLSEKGFKEIELWNDINGKPRFVSAKKL